MSAAHPVDQHTEQLVGLRRDVDDHESRLRVVEAASAKREEQIKNFYENIGAIKALIAQIDTKMDNVMGNLEREIKTALEGLDDRLKKLEMADGEKWKQAVWIVFALVAGGVVGMLFKK